MNVIKKSETTYFSNSPTCSGYEFAFGDQDLNVAVVTVDGRYPESGLLQNEVCKEIGYVLSGQGSIEVNGNSYQLQPGDAVMVQPGEKFFWRGEKLEMLMPCSPAFYPEQHQQVE